MPVEAYLTRQLSIRFIDARTLCTEARVSLGVEGYPTDDQEVMLIQEAIKIFARRPNETKTAMRSLKSNLDAVTSPAGSTSSFNSCESSDSEDASLSNAGALAGNGSTRSTRRTNRKFSKFWSIQRC
jgi:hypothetical protein